MPRRWNLLPVLCLALAACVVTPVAMAQDDYGLPELGGASASVSSGEEYRLGRAWLRQFRAQTDEWEDPIARDYIHGLVARLLPYTDVHDPVIVTLVDSRLLNAFAVPGGVMGVNSGLFTFADSEDTLASVIAHELGHLSQHHYARRMQRVEETQLPTMAAMLAGMVLAAGGAGDAGLATMVGSQAAFIQDQLAYSRRFEQEADRIGLDAMADAGFDPQAMPEMFRAMQHLASLQGGNPPEFLLTHPVTESRISDTQTRANQLPSPAPHTSKVFAMIRGRALLSLHRSDPEQAMTRLRQDDPPEAAVRYLQALIDAQRGNTAKALATLDALSEAQPDLSMLPASAAEVALDAGQRDDALRRARRILRLQPDYYPAQRIEAEVLLQQAPDQAFNVLRDMSDQYPEDPHVFALLAEAAGRSGRDLWGMLARAEHLQLTGHIDRAIKQIDIAEQTARDRGDFAMASRLGERRQAYLGYRQTLRNF
ncbi:M48 family metalloprotease [Chromohalobacter israelensis]|uniref:Putative beta-barrel assembly-enhancing protease n=1 Tax=Chromohalobacter israelensis (strain ATCC BAA-138 / DSM 3043 / CIP 106854 / NCIMB 13768 / 1H11) TaxID=290398 RepID=Q1QTP2_CHRI1|nr:M48 family metalloprotease [Chromohalobacter salexigens]ABE60166.1 peptidase M48, Ste24p [Chromohalobacter salexigens DSM 3043]